MQPFWELPTVNLAARSTTVKLTPTKPTERECWIFTAAVFCAYAGTVKEKSVASDGFLY